jgi:hypothetical protein
VRLILEALISFFPTEPKGAVGSLDWTPEERKRLAVEVGGGREGERGRGREGGDLKERDKAFVKRRGADDRSCCGRGYVFFSHFFHSLSTSLLPLPPALRGRQSQSWCCARCGLIKTLLPPLNTAVGEESGKEGEEGEEEGANGAENNGGASESAASQEEARGEDEEDGGQKEGGVKPSPGQKEGGVKPSPALKHESGGSSAAPSVPTPAEPNLRQQAAAPTSIPSSSSARQRSAGTRSSSINSPAVALVEENEGEEEKEDKLFYLAVFLFLLLILLVGRKLARAWIRQRGIYLEEGISASGWEDGIDL